MSTTITVTLSESTWDFVQAKTQEAGFGSEGEYIQAVLGQLHKQQARKKVEALLDEGCQSGFTEMTRADWDGLAQRVMSRLQADSHAQPS